MTRFNPAGAINPPLPSWPEPGQPPAKTSTGQRHLVLGGFGFVGRHVSALLAMAGHDVTVAGRHPQPVFDGLARVPRAVQLDMIDANWDAVLDGIDVVHHYAWSSILQTADADPVADLAAHVQPTVRLLEAIRRHAPKRLVFLSSGGTIYGDYGFRRSCETDEPRAASIYAGGKLAAEHYCRAFHRLANIDVRIVRMSNPFGLGQDPSRRQGLVSNFVRRAAAGLPLEIWGDGSAIRDYIHVSDAARALVEVAGCDWQSQEGDPLLVNVGSGEGVSILSVVETLEQVLQRKLDVVRLPGRSFDLPYNVLDISRMGRMFGWQPQLDIASGVALMLDDLAQGREMMSSFGLATGRPAAKPLYVM